MARNSEFYKGKKKRNSYFYLPVAVIVALTAILVVLFYSMQKYAVITKDDVKVEFPFMKSEDGESADGSGSGEKELERTEVSIIFDPVDYSNVEQIARTDLKPVRAIFVPHDELTQEKLDEYAARLQTGNALLLEMKPRSGNLMWYSHSRAATSYGLSVDNATTISIQSNIDMLKEKNVYLVAQISCCIDERYPTYSTLVALKSDSGMNYYDEYDMGFDEVVLADVMHPVPDKDKPTGFIYTAEMSTSPSPVGAVCGFALSVAGQLQDREEGKVLSIYCYTPISLVKADTGTGQNAPLFFKLFDRIYYPTDRGTYIYNLQDVTHSITTSAAASRFVPVVKNYLPDDPDKISWVLIDVDEG